MKVIRARNVNDAFYLGMRLLALDGQVCDSRVGTVYRLDEPVTTVYERPWERVIFSAKRDANPFFHLLEAIWMMSGSSDLELPAYLVPRMKDYSEDGKHNPATYGFRWRRYFGQDQLEILVNHLKAQPTSRRAYLGMWDPSQDLRNAGPQGKPDTASYRAAAKDVPCNLGCKFAIRDYHPNGESRLHGKLDMFVFNRSNDMVMGGYGANAVHMSILQEYIAGALGVGVGIYEQISCDFHAYQRDSDKFDFREIYEGDPYRTQIVSPFPLDGCDTGAFIADCERFVKGWQQLSVHYETNFFQYVVVNVMKAIRYWKDKQRSMAYGCAKDIGAEDWRKAATDWLDRRIAKETQA